MSGFATMTQAARHAHATAAPAHAPDPRLDVALRRALWLGATLVLLLPAARGHSAWLGWMPLWLLGMPAVSLWALYRFRVPPLFARAATSLRGTRRRRHGQARRRTLRPARRGSLRAA